MCTGFDVLEMRFETIQKGAGNEDPFNDFGENRSATTACQRDTGWTACVQFGCSVILKFSTFICSACPCQQSYCPDAGIRRPSSSGCPGRGNLQMNQRQLCGRYW